MTRINLVPPEELSNQHLVAEVHELPRIFTYAAKLKTLPEIPPRYVLGTGHVRFFVNKLYFLAERLTALRNEMRRRGFKVSEMEVKLQFNFPQILNWKPSESEIAVNRKRIAEKIAMKPNWYKFYDKMGN